MAASRFIAVFSNDTSQLVEFVHRLSPKVEAFPPDGFILEVPARYEQDTLSRLAQLTRNTNARIGGASTRVAAILAAKIRPGTVVPYGRESQFLSPFPIDSLLQYTHIDEQVLATLADWGIHCLGELCRLPTHSLVARLGQLGEKLKRLARGEDSDCFQPQSPPIEFEEKHELEWTLSNLEPLAFILGGMLERLCARIIQRGLAVEGLEVALKLSDRSRHVCRIRPALPMQDSKVILSLIRLELQSDPPRSGITQISVRATPSRPRFFQHSLLEPTAPHPEKLSGTLTRLNALVGETGLGSPRLVDTHRPDSFQMESFNPYQKLSRKQSVESWPLTLKFERERKAMDCTITQLSLRRLRPPQPIQIQTTEIISCAGPWKSSGDWWLEGGRTDGWSREEWDIEMADGGIYRVYWDYQRKEWLLEGIYD